MEFLDKNGLRTLWAQINNLVDSKIGSGGGSGSTATDNFIADLGTLKATMFPLQGQKVRFYSNSSYSMSGATYKILMSDNTYLSIFTGGGIDITWHNSDSSQTIVSSMNPGSDPVYFTFPYYGGYPYPSSGNLSISQITRNFNSIDTVLTGNEFSKETGVYMLPLGIQTSSGSGSSEPTEYKITYGYGAGNTGGSSTNITLDTSSSNIIDGRITGLFFVVKPQHSDDSYFATRTYQISMEDFLFNQQSNADKMFHITLEPVRKNGEDVSSYVTVDQMSDISLSYNNGTQNYSIPLKVTFSDSAPLLVDLGFTYKGYKFAGKTY